MPGAGLNSATDRKASPERSALKPYWGKPTVRNFRGGYGNGGIIRSPLSAMTLLDQHADEGILVSSLEQVNRRIDQRPLLTEGTPVSVKQIEMLRRNTPT